MYCALLPESNPSKFFPDCFLLPDVFPRFLSFRDMIFFASASAP